MRSRIRAATGAVYRRVRIANGGLTVTAGTLSFSGTDIIVPATAAINLTTYPDAVYGIDYGYYSFGAADPGDTVFTRTVPAAALNQTMTMTKALDGYGDASLVNIKPFVRLTLAGAKVYASAYTTAVSGVPTISGSAVVGQVLTATNPLTVGNYPIVHSTAWRECDSGGNNCAIITGETVLTYTVVTGDIGSTIRNRWTASSVTYDSNQTAVVTGGLMLDGISGIVAAYSTRKLVTAYAGSAIRVSRSSDSTEQDIGFSSDVLDTAALSTFVGANSATVVTWYDQSGNARNLTAAGGPRPRIVNAGTIDVINTTRPAMRYDGVNDAMDGTYSTTPTNVRHLFAVVNPTNFSDFRTITCGDGNGALHWRIDQTTGAMTMNKQGIAAIGTSSSSLVAATAALAEATYDNSAYSFFIDGTAAGSGTNAQTLTTRNMKVGDQGASEPFLGNIGELVISDVAGDLSAGNLTTIRDSISAYWGTP